MQGCNGCVLAVWVCVCVLCCFRFPPTHQPAGPVLKTAIPGPNSALVRVAWNGLQDPRHMYARCGGAAFTAHVRPLQPCLLPPPVGVGAVRSMERRSPAPQPEGGAGRAREEDVCVRACVRGRGQ